MQMIQQTVKRTIASYMSMRRKDKGHDAIHVLFTTAAISIWMLWMLQTNKLPVPETVSTGIFLAGAAVGMVLAGLASINRILLINQNSVSSMQQPGEEENQLDTLFSLLNRSISAGFILAAVSIAGLFWSGNELSFLLFWMAALSYALTVSMHSEYIGRKFFASLVKKSKNRSSS